MTKKKKDVVLDQCEAGYLFKPEAEILHECPVPRVNSFYGNRGWFEVAAAPVGSLWRCSCCRVWKVYQPFLSDKTWWKLATKKDLLKIQGEA